MGYLGLLVDPPRPGHSATRPPDVDVRKAFLLTVAIVVDIATGQLLRFRGDGDLDRRRFASGLLRRSLVCWFL
jgi:hypothetical protein